MTLELKPNWLDNLNIATPCRADWERMDWEDEEGRVRFCRTCEKNVYNISLMSRAEALDLIRAQEGQVCLRLSKRQDGTLITNDCPIGQSKRQTKRRFLTVIGAFLAALVPSVYGAVVMWKHNKPATSTPAQVKSDEVHQTSLLASSAIPTPAPFTVQNPPPPPQKVWLDNVESRAIMGAVVSPTEMQQHELIKGQKAKIKGKNSANPTQ